MLLFASLAKADNIENIIQSIERIEEDISDLQKQIYSNSGTIDSNAGNETFNDNVSIFDMRISEIESEVKQLTSYLEEYVFKIDELNERLDNLILDQSSNFIQNQNEDSNTTGQNSESDYSFSDNENQVLGSLSISNEDDLSEGEVTYEMSEKSVLPDIEPDEQYQYALDLLRSQKLEEAKIALSEFLSKNENHYLAGSANYWIGEIQYLQGNYTAAALTFAEGYQRYEDSNKVPNMLYRLGVSLSKIDKIDQACVTFFELLEKYPSSNLLNKANSEINNLNCQ